MVVRFASNPFPYFQFLIEGKTVAACGGGFLGVFWELAGWFLGLFWDWIESLFANTSAID